jgi:cob(I)alamin adenosyltransferase
MEKGIVQIYTGKGKGKTTAAVGLSVRAASYGLKIGFFQFFKPSCGETEVLKKFKNIHVHSYSVKHPSFQHFSAGELEEYKKKFIGDWQKIIKTIRKSNYDLVILDEILIAVRDKFLSEKALLDFLKKKPSLTEIVLTGRYITQNIIECADLVTEMKKIKHPFPGLKARQGIDY